MGAKQGNQNARKERTRVSACLSISDEGEKQRLSWAIRCLQEKGKEPTDQEISRFVKDYCYARIDEAMSNKK